jgi:hypothetical protein
MLRPHLPLDVLYVVACHLAGIHAFGTLASLYIANHDVAGTVLPVLYETLLIDNEEKLPIVNDKNGSCLDRFKYTKSVELRYLPQTPWPTVLHHSAGF